MDVSSVGNQTNAQRSGASLAQDFDTFLKLLTTQLQYQDPLQPLDSKDFTQQLVSFTGVEQQIATNKNLETLITQLAMQDMAGSVSYIGKDVIARTDAAVLADGGAEWTYSLDLMADNTKLLVRDMRGNVVYETTGETKAGIHSFKWNGRNANGEEFPEGPYTLEVQAAMDSGAAINSSVFVQGTVDGVERMDGQNFLSVNGLLLGIGQIQVIKQSKAPLPGPGGETNT